MCTEQDDPLTVKATVSVPPHGHDNIVKDIKNTMGTALNQYSKDL